MEIEERRKEKNKKTNGYSAINWRKNAKKNAQKILTNFRGF